MPATMTREAFERQKATYEQNALQMRSLNEQMNRVPTIAVTLTGGLWFAASQTTTLDAVIKFGLLIFAGVTNIGLVLACFRIRDVMQSYLEQMKRFAPASFADGRPEKPLLRRFSHYSMITIYASLMAVAGTMSFVGAFYSYWPFPAEYRLAGITIFGVILLVGLSVILTSKQRGR